MVFSLDIVSPATHSQLLVSSCNGLKFFLKLVICFAFLPCAVALVFNCSNKLYYQESSHGCRSCHSCFSDNFFTREPELEAEPLPWEIMPSSNRSRWLTQSVHYTFWSLDAVTIFHVQIITHDRWVLSLWLSGLAYSQRRFASWKTIQRVPVQVSITPKIIRKVLRFSIGK